MDGPQPRPRLRAPFAAGVVLALAHLGLSAWEVGHPRRPPVTYVFTPLVDVWPGGPALSADEGRDLGESLRHGIDAREISQAYASLGSTLSLADLLAGIEGLQGQLAPSPAQRQALVGIMEDAKADHASLVQVQDQILDLELRINRRVAKLRSGLPASIAPAPQGPPPPGPPGPPGPPRPRRGPR